MFAELGVAVVAADPGRAALMSAAAAEDGRIVAVEPERILYAIAHPAALAVDYLHGYHDAVAHLYAQVSGAGRARPRPSPPGSPTRQRSPGG